MRPFLKNHWRGFCSGNVGLHRGVLDSAPPVLPAFDYDPKPYKGPLAEEVLEKRRKYLGPSLFYYYQKPVSPCFLSLSMCLCLYI